MSVVYGGLLAITWIITLTRSSEPCAYQNVDGVCRYLPTNLGCTLPKAAGYLQKTTVVAAMEHMTQSEACGAIVVPISTTTEFRFLIYQNLQIDNCDGTVDECACNKSICGHCWGNSRACVIRGNILDECGNCGGTGPSEAGLDSLCFQSYYKFRWNLNHDIQCRNWSYKPSGCEATDEGDVNFVLTTTTPMNCEVTCHDRKS